MRKEVLIAIILGAALGLAIAFGVWRANLALTPKQTQQETTAPLPPTSTPTAPEPSIIVTQPEDEALVDTQIVTVEGKTIPGATVLITSPVDEIVVLADSSGVFKGDVKLESGTNAILVTTITKNDETLEQQLTVSYSTEFKKEQ